MARGCGVVSGGGWVWPVSEALWVWPEGAEL